MHSPNILPVSDHYGCIVATTDIVAGNHNDAFNLKPQLQSAFKAIKRLEAVLNYKV